MKLQPGAPVEDILREATPETLLNTFSSLTHRLDSISRKDWSASLRDVAAHEVRVQRDAVQAEIIRRMGAE